MRSLSTRAAGLLILALGIWGGLVPFIGHYFHFSLGPDQAWHWSRDRLFLDVLPGVAAILGGLMLIGSGPRRSARLGALLALVAGTWFAIGPDVSHLWNAAGAAGQPHGTKFVRVLELVAYHTGLGALIAALGGYALPRFIAPVLAAEPVEARPERPPVAEPPRWPCGASRSVGPRPLRSRPGRLSVSVWTRGPRVNEGGRTAPHRWSRGRDAGPRADATGG